MKTLTWLACLCLTSCTVVKMHRTRDDWATVDQTKVKRLSVVVQPLPAGQEKAGPLLGQVARRYVNMKREFLVMSYAAQAGAFDWKASCTAGLDGLIWLKPNVSPKGDGFEASVEARLIRCYDGQEAWAADAGGSFSSHDDGLKEVAANYGKELGPDVEPYVPLAMNLLRPVLDTLPKPVLTEDDVTEKMSLDD
ncbi:MAG: MXAN_6521/LA_1396 family lipoprotein [Myxococcaceae bacterium]|nr:MXAN_6521/LA_1396 family lipoprotein [Myxococcaceae bacterium]